MNKTDIGAKASKKLHLPKPLSLLWWLLMVVATFWILSINFLPDQLAYKVGDYATNNVYYFGTSTSYVSQVQTDAAKRAVAAEVPTIYESNDMAIVNVHKQIDTIFEQLEDVKESSLTDVEEIDELQRVLNDMLPQQAASYYLSAPEDSILQIISTLKDVVTSCYEDDVTDDMLAELAAAVDAEIEQQNFIPTARQLMTAVAGNLTYEATKVIDQVATNAAVNEAIAGVQPIQVKVNPGELVVRRGEAVSDTVLEALVALGLQSESGGFKSYIGLLLMVIICYLLFWMYYRKANRAVKGKNEVVVLSVLLMITIVIGKLFTLISINTPMTTDLMMGLLVPVPAFSMLATALVNRRSAIFGTIILSVFVGLMCNGHLLYVLASLVGGLIGIIQTGYMDKRSKYALASINISAAYCLLLLAWSFMWGYSISSIGFGLILSVLNGILSVILAIGALPFLENIFGITTEIHLLELSNTNHPLLKKLMIEAPGTYNHSVLVGNLAEAAADEIGANGLLVRVASYFHDIGKVKRPYMFIENQKPGDNPHDKLQPSLSTFIITSHTKEGAELAVKYKLPQEIIDIIEQHHGTSMVVGFYRKAVELAEQSASSALEVKKEDFRYPGPKPQTKEAALVMLADSCQAAVLAMESPTRGQMEGRVRDVIKGKVDDGQLENCALTFRDLDIIASTFVQVLAGVNHHRIPYPEQLEKELRNRVAASKKAEERAEAKAADAKAKADSELNEAAKSEGKAAADCKGEAEKPGKADIKPSDKASDNKSNTASDCKCEADKAAKPDVKPSDKASDNKSNTVSDKDTENKKKEV